MGANGGRQDQTELLMQQNANMAKQLQHKIKPGAVANEVGNRMMANMKFKGGAGPHQAQPIQIENVTYELLEAIGEGGFGKVYKAQVQNKNRIVAVKIMDNVPMLREELQNEVRFLSLTKKIPIDDHPVITYYGCKFTNEKIFIAMELASCDLVKFWFTHVVKADPENKFLLGITIIVYVLRALTFLEKLNIIHGDIKPQNLVVVPSKDCFHIKLIDFGTVEKMSTLAPQLTVDAGKAHTIFFASPEFLKRDSRNIMARHLHKKSDAWAAGVMFYILFFEKLPWKDQFDYENFCNDPQARDIQVPPQGGYKRIIELLLKKDPEKRASAKSTLMQMKAHPELQELIESLHESFCPVDDVCRIIVPDDVRNELAKLARPGHVARPSNERAVAGARRSCRYGTNCTRHDNVHLEEFAHPGDPDYRPSESGSNSHGDKITCRYGSDCFLRDADHLNRYWHPDEGNRHAIVSNGRNKPIKIQCHFGKLCHNFDHDHRAQYSHPDEQMHGDNGPIPCRFGDQCTKRHDREHMLKYRH